MRTNEVRKYISTKLKELGYKVYYHEATTEAKFPYIVYSLDAAFYENNTDYDLEINIWDNSRDIARIEDVADDVEELMDKEISFSENGLLIFRKQTRGNIDDPNKNLKRIMIKFNMKKYQ